MDESTRNSIRRSATEVDGALIRLSGLDLDALAKTKAKKVASLINRMAAISDRLRELAP